jgi:hypothetical protein
MSSYRAIAAASASLKTLLRDRMSSPVPVTIAPPDVTVQGISGERVNLYLYEIDENGNLSNQEIPGQGHPGAYGRPPLSIDLRYLLTAHGETADGPDADLQSQQILGDAMQVLHEFALITNELKISRSSSGTVGEPILDPELLHEFERIRVSLVPTTLEEITRIWTALPESSFRRSVVYHVSVVQIESRTSRNLALPVKTREIRLASMRRPQMTGIWRVPATADEPAGDPRSGVLKTLHVEGLNFTAAKTWVKISALDPIRVLPENDRRILIAVPDDAYPADPDHPLPRPIPVERQLQPGPQLVEVRAMQPADRVAGGLGPAVSTQDQVVLSSNQFVFMLVPRIASVSPATGPDGTVSVVTGHRLFHADLSSGILVGDRMFLPLDPAAADAPPGTVRTSNEVWVRVSGLPSGATYRVRVRVNGAESLEEDKTFAVMP